MKYIFRYESCNNLSLNNLRHGEFFFASASEVNDPTEATPLYRFKGNPDLWSKFTEYILFNAINDLINIASKDGKELLHFVLDRRDEINLELRKSIGNRACLPNQLLEVLIISIRNVFPEINNKHSNFITFLINNLPSLFDTHINNLLREQTKFFVSFSLNPLNPTMWGHYANSYRGYCLIFQPEDSKIKIRSPEAGFNIFLKLGEDGKAEPRDETELLVEQMKYRAEPPTVNAFHLIHYHFFYTEIEDHYDVPAVICSNIPPYSSKDVGLVKYTNWKYEREVRCFYPFDITHEREKIKAPEIRFANYHPSHFVGAILGPNIEKSNIDRLYKSIVEMLKWGKLCFNILEQKETDILIFKAEQLAHSYQLIIKPYAILKISKYFNLEIINSTCFNYEQAQLMEQQCNSIMNDYK